jgi:hypothetical protein
VCKCGIEGCIAWIATADGGVSHFAKMATQREEEVESGDSIVPGFGTDDAVRTVVLFLESSGFLYTVITAAALQRSIN